MTTQSTTSQGRGCLFYGIIAALVLLVLTVIGLFVSYRFVKNSVGAVIQTYTHTNAAPIQVVELSSDRLKDVQSRVERFRQGLEKQESSQELVLSAEDINGLIAGDPNFKELKNHLFVKIEDERISGDVSYPLPNVGPFKLKGRYLNGEAAFKVSLTNGNLWVSMESVKVNGNPLPSILQNELVKQNLASDVRQKPDIQTFLNKMESIRVEDGSIILRTKGSQDP